MGAVSPLGWDEITRRDESLVKSSKTSWEELFNKFGDTLIWKDISDADWKRSFNAADFGAPEGTPFIAYSDNFVYFSTEYDGKESIGRVPRSPAICMKLKYKRVYAG